MGLRFRRRISLIPGLRLNVGLRGVSASIGRRGAWLTLKPGRAPRATVGLPGSGISYTTSLGGVGARQRHGEPPGAAQSAAEPDPDGELASVHLIWVVILAAAIVGAIFWIRSS